MLNYRAGSSPNLRKLNLETSKQERKKKSRWRHDSYNQKYITMPLQTKIRRYNNEEVNILKFIPLLCIQSSPNSSTTLCQLLKWNQLISTDEGKDKKAVKPNESHLSTWYMWGRVHKTRSIPYFTCSQREELLISLSINRYPECHAIVKEEKWLKSINARGKGSIPV